MTPEILAIIGKVATVGIPAAIAAYVGTQIVVGIGHGYALDTRPWWTGAIRTVACVIGALVGALCHITVLEDATVSPATTGAVIGFCAGGFCTAIVAAAKARVAKAVGVAVADIKDGKDTAP